jgi:hypothetical protein
MPTPVHHGATLITKKAGKKPKNKKLFIHVTASDGSAPRDVLSPFQRPQFKNIQVSIRTASGAPDQIVVTARKGKKTLSRVFPA